MPQIYSIGDRVVVACIGGWPWSSQPGWMPIMSVEDYRSATQVALVEGVVTGVDVDYDDPEPNTEDMTSGDRPVRDGVIFINFRQSTNHGSMQYVMRDVEENRAIVIRRILDHLDVTDEGKRRLLMNYLVPKVVGTPAYVRMLTDLAALVRGQDTELPPIYLSDKENIFLAAEALGVATWRMDRHRRLSCEYTQDEPDWPTLVANVAPAEETQQENDAQVAAPAPVGQVLNPFEGLTFDESMPPTTGYAYSGERWSSRPRAYRQISPTRAVPLRLSGGAQPAEDVSEEPDHDDGI